MFHFGFQGTSLVLSVSDFELYEKSQVSCVCVCVCVLLGGFNTFARFAGDLSGGLRPIARFASVFAGVLKENYSFCSCCTWGLKESFVLLVLSHIACFVSV